MGGGRKHLMPDYETDPEYRHLQGDREDGRHIINEWIAHKVSLGKEAQFVWGQAGFEAVDPKTTDHLLGKENLGSNLDSIELDRKITSRHLFLKPSLVTTN